MGYASTVDGLLSWLDEHAGKKSYYGPIKSQIARSAVQGLAERLGPNEQRDLGYFVAHLPDLLNAAAHGGVTGSSARTYASRARVAANDFMLWLEKPSEFESQIRQRLGRSGSRTARATAERDDAAAKARPEGAEAETFDSFRGTTQVRAEDGGLTVRIRDDASEEDVVRTVFHLLAHFPRHAPRVWARLRGGGVVPDAAERRRHAADEIASHIPGGSNEPFDVRAAREEGRAG